MYILKNEKNKLYIGSTNNLEIRLEEHRTKKVFSTQSYGNFVLFYYEAYAYEKDARIREKHLKYFGKACQQLKKRINGGLVGAG